MKALFIKVKWGQMKRVNLGLAYVISSVKMHHQVKFINTDFYRELGLISIEEEIENFEPDVICFSVTSFNYENALEIGSFIKKIYPKAIHLYGGVQPTLLPDETIENPLVDAICIGEGEIALLEYLDRLDHAKEPLVEGIWFKNRKGKIIRNKLRPYIENLDVLPFPDWDLWDIEKYFIPNICFPNLMTMIATRGCPYRCPFCSEQPLSKVIPGESYRKRSIGNIIDEIKINFEKYRSIGLQITTFYDSTFGFDKEWMQDFCRTYRREILPLGLLWSCETRVDVITKDWVTNAALSGCMSVALGVESGDENTRNKIFKKNISDEQIKKAVRLLQDNNIMTIFFMMIGHPEETKKSIEKSLNLPKTLNVDRHFCIYQALPKTSLIKLEEGENLINTKVKRWFFVPYPWYIAKTKTKGFSKIDIEIFFLRARKDAFIRYFREGYRLKRIIFLSDIFKYILSKIGYAIRPFLFINICEFIVYYLTRKYKIDLKKKEILIGKHIF